MNDCKNYKKAFLPALWFVLMMPSPASAMHITEGILPAPKAILWLAVAAPFFWWGLRIIRLRSRQNALFKSYVGLVGAAVFIISCLPIPVPYVGTTAHPCGTGLAAVLISPGPTVVVAAIALLLQALFMAHGGLTTLGANIVSMGVVGVFVGYGSYKAALSLKLPVSIAVFLAGLLSDWATYIMTAFILANSLTPSAPFGSVFKSVIIAFMPTQLPLGVFEGVLAVGAYRFIETRLPKLTQNDLVVEVNN